jgi:hypothetical protein
VVTLESPLLRSSSPSSKGGKGFADVWKRGFFAWEYKGSHKDLQTAYLQLADYCEDLENPPFQGTKPAVARIFAAKPAKRVMSRG